MGRSNIARGDVRDGYSGAVRRILPLGAAVVILAAACDGGPAPSPTSAEPSPPGPSPPATSTPGTPASPVSLGWARLEPAPTARTEVAAAAADGLIYVVGGFSEEGGATTAVEIYDPAAGSWTRGPDLPIPVHHAMAAAGPSGLMVFGGYLAQTLSDPSDRAFVLQGDHWEELPRMPEPRAAGGAAALLGRYYVVGGVGPGGLADSTLVFDPTTLRWWTAPGLPTPREHLGVATDSMRIYAVGGRTGGIGSNLPAAEAFDAGAGRWSALPDMPTPRGGIAAAFAEGGFVVAPGGEAETTFPEVEAFDIEAGIWLSLPPLPTPRHGLGVVALGTTVYVIAGGPVPGLSFSSANEAIDLAPLRP